jgi:uncharacterized membrane protein YeaQ/YmgE (transglycosylase-associated protein family)
MTAHRKRARINHGGKNMEETVATGSGFLISLIVWIVVGGIAGWLAGVLVKGYGFGLVGNVILGIVGAFVGGWVFSLLGISLGSGYIGAVIGAAIGAIILLLIIGLFRRA